MTKTVNGALEFMWEHSEHLVNNAIRTWRFAFAKRFAFTKGTFPFKKGTFVKSFRVKAAPFAC